MKSNLKQGSKFYGLWVIDQETDIIGFKDFEELKGLDIKIDYPKYEKILKDKINNLKKDTVLRDFAQNSLNSFFR